MNLFETIKAAVPRKLKHHHIRQFWEDEMLCFRVPTDYLHLLEDWKVQYAPKTPEDDLDARFVEACQMLARITSYIEEQTKNRPGWLLITVIT